MELSELEIGTKLELEIFDESGDRLEPALISEFEWYEGGNKAVIAAPIFEGNIVPLQIDSAINIYFIQKRENLKSLYKFTAVIKDREISGNLHILVIEKQSEIVRVQRRTYFRLDCFIELKYLVIDTTANNRYGDAPRKRALVDNLSGGGICLLLDEKINAGHIIECELFADQDRKIRFFGNVVRFEEIEKEGRYKYRAGIAYINISDSDREAIIRYIFNEQRKLLEKGLT